MQSDSYRLLGIQRNASADEIKRAFRRLVVTCHPDLCKTEAEARVAKDKFFKLKDAYDYAIAQTKSTAHIVQQAVANAEQRAAAAGNYRDAFFNPQLSLAENLCRIFPELDLHLAPPDTPDTVVFYSSSRDGVFELGHRLVNMGREVGGTDSIFTYSFGDNVTLRISKSAMSRLFNIEKMIKSGLVRYEPPYRAANGNIRLRLDMRKLDNGYE